MAVTQRYIITYNLDRRSLINYSINDLDDPNRPFNFLMIERDIISTKSSFANISKNIFCTIPTLIIEFFYLYNNKKNKCIQYNSKHK